MPIINMLMIKGFKRFFSDWAEKRRKRLEKKKILRQIKETRKTI